MNYKKFIDKIEKDYKEHDHTKCPFNSCDNYYVNITTVGIYTVSVRKANINRENKILGRIKAGGSQEIKSNFKSIEEAILKTIELAKRRMHELGERS